MRLSHIVWWSSYKVSVQAGVKVAIFKRRFIPISFFQVCFSSRIFVHRYQGYLGLACAERLLTRVAICLDWKGPVIKIYHTQLKADSKAETRIEPSDVIQCV